MSGNLRVHIAPVGFEFRRVTEPLIRMQADKVYFVKYKKDNKAARQFFANIKAELAKKYKHIRIEEVDLEVWDLYECIEKFGEIIKNEKEHGNHVYINVSTGTKITAIAGMLACMLGRAKPYYAPISYRSREIEVPKTESVMPSKILPTYDVREPRKEFMQILRMLQKHNGTMKKKEMIEELEESKLIRSTNEDYKELGQTAKHSQLRALLDPMKTEWNFISVEASGRRSVVSITEQGKTALKIFGHIS